MTEKTLGALGRYAERLDRIDPTHLEYLDPWFEAALTSSATVATGTTASLAAAKFGLIRRIAVLVALATPPAVGVGAAVLDHQPPPAAVIEDETLHEPTDGSPPGPTWRIALARAPRLPPLVAEPIVEPAVVTVTTPRPSVASRPPARPPARPSTPVPPRPRPSLDIDPTPEELAQIDRARSLADQAGRETDAEAEYVALIEQSPSQHVVEVAYRELITKLIKDRRIDTARRYSTQYSRRFPDGRYNRLFQITLDDRR